MNTLSIDTTTKKANVTLKKDNLIFSSNVDNEITHSEKLLPLIDDILQKNDICLKSIDNYLILNGPGSFTGIRISLSTVKAFSQIFDKKVFTISSLEALAYIGYKNSNINNVVTFIDAKNERVYFSIYNVENLNGKIKITNMLEIRNEYLEDANEIINDFTKQNNIKNYYTIGNINDVSLNYYPTSEDLIDIYENIYDVDSYLYNCYNLNANYARVSQAERVKNGEN